ncbi:MAG TPA: DUF4870 domain-containing protein [Candidatus Acidoferrales bacterium]|nr:DUF4870 domain-containing protein [Candidatus Acidoferrales bacterium]
MAFCSNCGAQVADGSAFCANCGRQVSAPSAASPAPSPVAPSAASSFAAQPSATPGMQENVAGLLCYVLGWLTGLIFLLIDKRPFVRFHAAQSIAVFGVISILYVVFGQVFVVGVAVGGAVGFGFGTLLLLLLRVGAIGLWILLMVKAYQGERYKLPLFGDYAESLAGKIKT